MMLLSTKNSDRGSALAEMTILLPIYVSLMTGAIYLAHLGLMKTGAQKVVGYAAMQSGRQSLDSLTDLMAVRGPVFVTSFDDPEPSEEVISASDVSAVLEDMARAPVGHYELQGDEIVYVLDEDRLSSYGSYIFDNNLQDESGNVAEIFGGWMYEGRSSISCRYDPLFGEWDSAEMTDISSVSYVNGGRDRGEHPVDQPTFNTEIVEMLSSSDFPDPISTDPNLWLPQSR